MTVQVQAATQAMVEWLSDEHELGRAPAQIEVAGEFDLHGLHYYIFRYRANALSEWLLGVCGGYEGQALQHCGHIFSEMEPFDAVTAQQKSIAMVEMIRKYWMQLAQDELASRESTEEEEEAAPPVAPAPQLAPVTEEEDDGFEEANGPFVGFVLLDSPQWDVEGLRHYLLEDWQIHCPAEGALADDEETPSLVFELDQSLVAISMIPAPIPDGEAEHNAATNYLWPEAVAVTQTHVAHIMVAVLNHGQDVLDVGKLFVKVCAACLKQPNAIGIYVSGTVFQPKFYLDMANDMSHGDLPVFNWIYFGLYETDQGRNGYTYGLSSFGKDEIEVIGSHEAMEDIHLFLYNIANYVLENDVILQDGETIGFTAEQKLLIRRSEGVALEGETIKIGY